MSFAAVKIKKPAGTRVFDFSHSVPVGFLLCCAISYLDLGYTASACFFS